MRWLLAAAQAAQRRYRLTNLLLLLLRCLIVLLVALAIARPALPGFGGGERLVLVVDRSASMGARGSDPGPLASVKALLAQAELDYRSVVLLGVADDVQPYSVGSMNDFRTALGRLEVSDLPGGLERASTGELASQLTGYIGNGADIVLISDFQQDDAAQLVALLTPRCRTLSRLVVGKQNANGVVAGIKSLGDLRPDLPGELVMQVVGEATGIELAVDEGTFLPISGTTSSAGSLHVALPPMAAGPHTLRLRLSDTGLLYDNLLELPVLVRGKVSVLAISDRTDYLIASLKADDPAFARTIIQAPALPGEPLPNGGLLALRTPVADGKRIAEWVRGGGVLWAPLEVLRADQDLRALVAEILVSDEQRRGGPYHTGENDIDEVLRVGARESVPAFTLPTSATPVLWAGEAPLMVRLPSGSGQLIVELTDLVVDESLRARGTFPLWINRLIRRVTAELSMPSFAQAGQAALHDMTLRRGAQSLSFITGQPLLLAPGIWSDKDQHALVILPSRTEGVLQQDAPRGAVTTIAEALPQRPGSDWALPLAIAALITALSEGLVAAWAGKAFGSRSDQAATSAASHHKTGNIAA
jgi:hypothetical protein